MIKQGVVSAEPVPFVKKNMFVAVVDEDDEVIGFGRIESYKRQGHIETMCWVISNDEVIPGAELKKFELNFSFPQSRLRQFLISEKTAEGQNKYLLKFNQWKSALLNGEVGTGKEVKFATYQRIIPEEKQREGGPKYIEFARVLPNKRDTLTELLTLRNDIDNVLSADNQSAEECIFLREDKLNLDQMISFLYKMKEPNFEAASLVSPITRKILIDNQYNY